MEKGNLEDRLREKRWKILLWPGLKSTFHDLVDLLLIIILQSPLFCGPAIYHHQDCCPGWASHTHTHLFRERSGSCRPRGSGPPCPSFQTPSSTQAASLTRRNEQGLPPCTIIHPIHSSILSSGRLFCSLTIAFRIGDAVILNFASWHGILLSLGQAGHGEIRNNDILKRKSER